MNEEEQPRGIKIIYYCTNCKKCPYFFKGVNKVRCDKSKDEIEVDHIDRQHPYSVATSRLWLKCIFRKGD